MASTAIITANGFLAIRDGKALTNENGTDCCKYHQAIKCVDDTLVDMWVQSNPEVFDSTGIYRNTGHICYRFGDPYCLPEGATVVEVGDLEGAFNNCQDGCGWRRAINCATDEPLDFYVFASDFDPDGIYKHASGVCFKLGAIEILDGIPTTQGAVTPYATCAECLATECCAAGNCCFHPGSYVEVEFIEGACQYIDFDFIGCVNGQFHPSMRRLNYGNRFTATYFACGQWIATGVPVERTRPYETYEGVDCQDVTWEPYGSGYATVKINYTGAGQYNIVVTPEASGEAPYSASTAGVFGDCCGDTRIDLSCTPGETFGGILRQDNIVVEVFDNPCCKSIVPGMPCKDEPGPCSGECVGETLGIGDPRF